MSHKKTNRGPRNPQFARQRDNRLHVRQERKEAFVLILHPALWQFDNEGAA